MEVLTRPRRAGKTYDLITKYFLGQDTLLLVMSEQAKRGIVARFDLDKSDQDRIFSWDNAQEKLACRRGVVIIDDADVLLEQILRAPAIGAVTINGQAR